MGVTMTSGITVTSGAGSINTTGNQGQVVSPASTVFGLGTSNFTIEGYFKPTAKTNTNPILISNGNFGSNKWQLNDRNGSNTKFDFGAYSASQMSSTTTPVNGTWYYVSVTRNGSTFWMHVNGIQEATFSNAGSIDGGGSQTIYLAGDQSQLNLTSWNGQMTSVRITVGTAIYGAANYSVPTLPIPPVANTQLLLNAYPQAIYADQSVNNFTMTVNTVSGQPSWNSATPYTQ
jgi:hypothetical protein